MTTKPNLTRVWASGAPDNNIEDPDVTTPGKFAAGWTAEIPPFEHFNFLQQLFTQALSHVNKFGIAQWDTNTEYPKGGWARSTVDSEVYISLIADNQGSEPSESPTKWGLLSDSLKIKDSLKVGDFGIGSSSSANKARVLTSPDLKGELASGLYFAAGNPSNRPVGTTTGHVIVNNNQSADNDDFVSVIFIPKEGGNLYFKTRDNKVWGDWKSVISTEEPQSWKRFTISKASTPHGPDERAAGNSYTNTTGRPIQVSVRVTVGNNIRNGISSLTVDGFNVSSLQNTDTKRLIITHSATIPNNSQYILDTFDEVLVHEWHELS